MKVALVIERFDPSHGGAEHWTWQFARALVSRGYEVHVVAFHFHQRNSEDGIVTHKLEMPRSRLDRAEALAREIGRGHYDIVHDMGVGWRADIIQPHAGSTIALWEHNLMRIPKWRQIRFWRERRYRELAEIERRQHANGDAIIAAVSRMLADEFEALHHLAPERIRVIPNGVDVDRFSPANRDRFRDQTRGQLGLDDQVLFLMLAHNVLLKNAEVVVRAAARLIAGGANIRVVIGGGRKPRFEKLVEKLGVESVVRFVGPVDSVPFYAAADVYVQPTWYDPCSLVTLEASSSGLPVITSRFNGAAEMMTGKEGFVVDDPGNVTAVAACMGELLDRTLREKMGAAGRQFAMQHTFENQTDQFLTLYHQIVDHRKTASSPSLPVAEGGASGTR